MVVKRLLLFMILLLVLLNTGFSDYLKDIKEWENKNKKDQDFLTFLQNNKELMGYIEKNLSYPQKIDLTKLGYVTSDQIQNDNVTLSILGEKVRLKVLPSQIDQSLIVSERYFYPSVYNLFGVKKRSWITQMLYYLSFVGLVDSIVSNILIRYTHLLDNLKPFLLTSDPYVIYLLTQNTNLSSKYNLEVYPLISPSWEIPKEDFNQNNTPWMEYYHLFKDIKNGDYTLNKKIQPYNVVYLKSLVNQLNNLSNQFEGNFISGVNKAKLDESFKIITHYLSEGSSNIQIETTNIVKYSEIIEKTKKLIDKIMKESKELDNSNAWDEKEKLKELEKDISQLIEYLAVLENVKNLVDSTLEKLKDEPGYSDLVSLSNLYPALTQYTIDHKFSPSAPLDKVVEELANFILYLKGGKIDSDLQRRVEFLCKWYNYRVKILTNFNENLAKSINNIQKLSDSFNYFSLVTPSVTMEDYESKYSEDFNNLLGEGFVIDSLTKYNNRIEEICKKNNLLLTDLNHLVNYLNNFELNVRKKYDSISSGDYYYKNLDILINNVSKKIQLLNEICKNSNREDYCQDVQTLTKLWKNSLYSNWDNYLPPFNLNIYSNKYLFYNEFTGRIVFSTLFLKKLNTLLKDLIDKTANEKLVLFEVEKDYLEPVIFQVDDSVSLKNSRYSLTYKVKPLIKLNVKNGEYLGTPACSELELPLSATEAKISKTDLDILKVKPINNKMVEICFNTLERNKTYHITFEWDNYSIVHVKNVEKQVNSIVSNNNVVSLEMLKISLEEDPYFKDKAVKLIFLFPDNVYKVSKIETKYNDKVVLENILKEPLLELKTKMNITKGKLFNYTFTKNFILLAKTPQQLNVTLTFTLTNVSMDKVKVRSVTKNGEPINYIFNKKEIIIKDNFYLDKPSKIEYTIQVNFLDIDGLRKFLEEKLKDYKSKKLGDFEGITIEEIKKNLENLEYKYNEQIGIAESLINGELNLKKAQQVISIFKKLDEIQDTIQKIIRDYSEIQAKYEKVRNLCNKLKKILGENNDINYKLIFSFNKTSITLDTSPLFQTIQEEKEKVCSLLKDLQKLKSTNVGNLEVEVKLEINRKKKEVMDALGKILMIFTQIKKDACYSSNINLLLYIEKAKKHINNFMFDDSLGSISELKLIKQDLTNIIEIIKSFNRELCDIKIENSVNELLQNLTKKISKIEKELVALKPSNEAYQKCISEFSEETCNVKKSSLDSVINKISNKISYVKNQIKFLKNIKDPVEKSKKLKELNKIVAQVQEELDKITQNIKLAKPVNPHVEELLKEGKLGDYYLLNNKEEKSSFSFLLFGILALLAVGGAAGYYLYKKGYFENLIGNKKQEDEEEDDFLLTGIQDSQTEKNQTTQTKEEKRPAVELVSRESENLNNFSDNLADKGFALLESIDLFENEKKEDKKDSKLEDETKEETNSFDKQISFDNIIFEKDKDSPEKNENTSIETTSDNEDKDKLKGITKDIFNKNNDNYANNMPTGGTNQSDESQKTDDVSIDDLF